jgi:diphosphomevalonate decarboxylase
MQLSMQTSELLKLRLENNLPLKHIDQLKQSLSEMDFHTFAEVTIRESNQLHAVCLDTLPAIFYMNNASKLIVNTVRDLN